MNRAFLVAALLATTFTVLHASDAFAQRHRGGGGWGGGRPIFTNRPSGGSYTRPRFPTTDGHRPWPSTQPGKRWPNNTSYPKGPWNRPSGRDPARILNGVANVISAVGSLESSTADSSGGATLDAGITPSADSGPDNSGPNCPSCNNVVQTSGEEQSIASEGSAVEVPSNPLPNGSDPASGDSTGTTESVTILNPAETGQTVSYLFGSETSSLASGAQNVHAQAGQEISFDRGASYGSVRYTLAAGTYRFIATAEGWDLRSVTQ